MVRLHKLQKLAAETRGRAKKNPNLFLSELSQISTKFDNFWHTGGQENRIM